MPAIATIKKTKTSHVHCLCPCGKAFIAAFSSGKIRRIVECPSCKGSVFTSGHDHSKACLGCGRPYVTDETKKCTYCGRPRSQKLAGKWISANGKDRKK